jgi:hypothetical protein
MNDETHLGRIKQDAPTVVFLFVQENRAPVPDVMIYLRNRLMYLLRADTV